MRIKADFNPEWRFHLGDIESTKKNSHTDAYYSTKAGRQYNPASAAWDDTGWQTVDLPHDYIVGMPFAPDTDISHGYHVKENAWYRKVFVLPKEWEGKHILLSLEGIAVNSVIYFNGSVMARHNNAYIEANIDLTDRAYFGDTPNVVAVYVDGTSSSGWWYEGAGLYRHARLYVKETLHIAHNGVYVCPEFLENTENDFVTRISVSAENSGYTTRSCRVRAELFYRGEAVAEGVCAPFDVAASQAVECTLTIPAISPRRWDVDTPNLYTARITLLDENGDALDTEEVEYGYRTFSTDPDRGFFLNGRPLKIRGVCNHQDHAGVGVAVPDAIQDYRVRLLKEMGANAYRCAHNPPAREILDACDRYGLIVMDENRRFEASPEEISYLEALIRRDRNHPSVIFWSLFNEEPLQNTPEGAAIFRRQRAAVERLDTTRPILGAMNGNAEGAGQHMSVVGINYGFGTVDAAHEKYPMLCKIGSENCSTLATRGCTETSPRGKIKNSGAERIENDPQVMSDYDEEFPGWGSSVRAAWRFASARPWFSGIFIWTGFDYRGEPTPFAWPSVSSQFGLMDTCGHPKAAYYFTKACYSDEPMIYVTPHWNHADGDVVRVMTISSCEEVELFLNGTSLGRRKNDVTEQNEWQVPFAPGVLSAVGYRDGEAVAWAEQRTAGKAVAISLSADRTTLMADGHDATPVTVSLLDAEGNTLPTATDHIRFSVEGGRILGTGNGDPNSHENDTLPERDLFAGYAQVIVATEHNSDGILRLRATCEGLPDAVLEIAVEPADQVPTIGACSSTVLHGLTVSEASEACPDYMRPLADNDMNTLSPTTLGATCDVDFTRGWRFYRARVTAPKKSCEHLLGVIDFSGILAHVFAVAKNGEEIHRAEKVYLPRRVTFDTRPGEEIDLRFLVEAWGEKPSGLSGQIKLFFMDKDEA